MYQMMRAQHTPMNTRCDLRHKFATAYCSGFLACYFTVLVLAYKAKVLAAVSCLHEDKKKV